MKYCDWFTSLSLSVNIWCFKGLVSGAISTGNGVTIGSLGVGIGAATSGGVSFSQTYYWQLSGADKDSNNSAAKSAIYSKTKWLMLVYTLFF